MRDLALDVLRHRLVLSYEALADDVTPDDILDRVLAAVPLPESCCASDRPPTSPTTIRCGQPSSAADA